MHEVYRAYDGRGRLLYIGCCLDVERRWDGHRRTAMWRSYCFKLVSKRYPNKEVARAIEARAISILAPFYNGQHNRRKRTWAETVRYEKRAKVRTHGRPEIIRRWVQTKEKG